MKNMNVLAFDEGKGKCAVKNVCVMSKEESRSILEGSNWDIGYDFYDCYKRNVRLGCTFILDDGREIFVEKS